MLEIHSVVVVCGICNRSRRPAVFLHDFFSPLCLEMDASLDA